MAKNRNEYIPALQYNWLTFLYDPILKWIMHESTFKRHLIDQARIKQDQKILDLGCGTATLTLMIKHSHPQTEVVGLDGDPKVLKIAQAKAVKTGLDITFDLGMTFQLPYPENSFDHVFSSLVLHHLTTENKNRTLREVFRIIRPCGELYIADFGKPHNSLARLISIIMQRFEQTSDNIKGLLPEMFRNAGFDQVEETARFMTIFGTISLFRAHKPG